MRLSDAMATGRVTMDKVYGGDISGCVLGMAANAVGISLEGTPYPEILDKWKWLRTRHPCPVCNRYGLEEHTMAAIYHAFDFHVMIEKTFTLDQLIDWVRSIEPPESLPETQGETASSPSNSLPREVVSASDRRDVAQPVAAIASGKMGAFTWFYSTDQEFIQSQPRIIAWIGRDEVPERGMELKVVPSYVGFDAYWEPGYCGCEDCRPIVGHGRTEEEAVEDYWKAWESR